MPSGVYFGGKQIDKPGAYSVVDTSSMTPVVLGGQRILAMIGECEGGEPHKVLWFNNPTAAKEKLIDGDLLNAMEIAWDPANELNGADLIAAVRVNNATKATHTLQDAVAANAITLTAQQWGDYYTYQVKVTAGDTAGHVVVSITNGVDTETLPEFNTNDEIVDYINANSQLVTATKVSDIIIDTTAAWVTFSTPGTNPDPAAQDWEDCVDLLNIEEVHGIVPITSDATVHAYVKTHVNTMSSLTNRKERRMFVGHALGETVDQITTRATNLGSERALLATPGIKRAINGTTTTLSSVFTAAAIAGMWAGNDIAEPLTFDYINCLGLEKIYDSLDIGTLIQGGVTVVELVPNKGYRIVQALTTYLASENIAKQELVCSTLADFMSKNLRENLEDKFVGKKPSKDNDTSIYNRTISILNQFETEGWIVAGEDAAGNTIPAYRNVRITKDGTVRRVEWEGSIMVPDNFILITSHFTIPTS